MLNKKVIIDWLKNNSPHKLIQRLRYYRSYFKKPCEIINEEEPNTFEIYTVAFNNDKVIDYQIKLIKKNFVDNHLHIIVDNSSDNEISKKIRKICEKNDTMYIRLPKNPLFSSQSHALSLNYTYKNFIQKRWCKYFWFLDHDIFPIKKTEIKKYLDKQWMYWYLMDWEKLEYARNARTIWPWFCFFKKWISKNFNFKPKKSLFPLYALDTGWSNYKLIFRKYDKKKLEFCTTTSIWIHEDQSEEEMSYSDIKNYSLAYIYYTKNKIVDRYEYIKDGEWIHKSWTYVVDKNMLNIFYKKLDKLS